MKVFVIAALFMTIMLQAVHPSEAAMSAPNGGWDAAWSADGTMLAFLSGSRHGIPNLWTLPLLGKRVPQEMTKLGAHDPVWLPGGHQVVFGTTRTGTPTFWRVDATNMSSTEQAMPNIPAGAETPVFSADGSLFAYAVTLTNNSARDLYFGRTSGGAVEALTRNFWVRQCTWAPDGSALAFVVGKAAGTSLWSVNLADKELDLLYRGFCMAPAYSPDGTMLALAVPELRSGFTIQLITLKTHESKKLTLKSFDGEQILWAPDSKSLYFTSSRKSEPAVWKIQADGQGLTRLTPNGLPAWKPALSPDGRYLAFQAVAKDSYGTDLYLCETNGSHLSRLTKSFPADVAPAFSPDGSRLAFQSDRNHLGQLFVGRIQGRFARFADLLTPEVGEVIWAGNDRLFVADGGRVQSVDAAHAGNVSMLTALKSPVQFPCINGEEIFFSEWAGPNAHIAAAKFDGSAKRQITVVVPANAPAPAPAETSPAAKTDRSMAPGMQVAGAVYAYAGMGNAAGPDSNQETGNPHSGLGVVGPVPDENAGVKVMTRVADLAPAVSPDGSKLVFVRQGQVWLTGRAGGDARQLTSIPAEPAGKRVVTRPVWSPDGEDVLFLSIRKDIDAVVVELWLTGLTPGSERVIYAEKARSEFGMYYLSCTAPPAFTADGQRILFTSVSESSPRIVTVAKDGSALNVLVQAPSSYPALDVSGKRLAYISLEGSRERLMLLDLKTGKAKPVAP